MPRFTLDPDPWLGGALGLSALRLTFPVAPGPTPPQVPLVAIGHLDKTPPPSEAVFIYAKVDVADQTKAAFLEGLGFHLVDTNLTFEKSLDPGSWQREEGKSVDIRMADASDEDAVVRMASGSFGKSRFHVDPGIPEGAADRMKGEWVRNYFLGARGDALVVAESRDGLAGFLMLLKTESALVIDLVAVDPLLRGKAVARSMTRFAESRFPSLPRVRVGTQIGNTPAIRAYQKMGFSLVHSQYVFHYHGAMAAILPE